MLHGWVGQGASPIPAISPSGDRVAWSLKFMLNADIVKCDPSNKRWCDLKPKPIYKSVMGVYSVQDKTWKQYGEFDEVGSAAFSPDGNKVAFFAQKGCTLVRCDDGVMILDIETGQMTHVPKTGPFIEWNAQLSWSPDGKFLAGTFDGPGGKLIVEQIVVIDIATGEMKTITEGRDPSWSPKGDWIAYGYMIIHPDGTGARSVLEREHKWMNWAVDAPIVWSPDGEKLLLNQRNSDAAGSRVIMVDLATGHAVRISKNGEVVVSGWVPYSGK
jgi:Tol biopolymer transport system component